MRVQKSWRSLVMVAVTSFALCSGWQQASAQVTAASAQGKLVQGNARYVGAQALHPGQTAARRIETATQGQKPFATIISCADSRVPVELIFDQGIGDIFVVRDAGNVCGPLEIGSTEYAVEHLHTPLVVVLGHTQCGAVSAAVAGGHAPGCIGALVAKIEPALAAVRHAQPGLKADGLIAATVEANVWQSMRDLIAGSEILREGLAEGKIAVVGAVYNISDGKVSWLGPHPRQKELLAATAEHGTTHK